MSVGFFFREEITYICGSRWDIGWICTILMVEPTEEKSTKIMGVFGSPEGIELRKLFFIISMLAEI